MKKFLTLLSTMLLIFILSINSVLAAKIKTDTASAKVGDKLVYGFLLGGDVSSYKVNKGKSLVKISKKKGRLNTRL